MYYAEIINHQQFGYDSLFRFATKQDRDEFVAASQGYAHAVRYVDAVGKYRLRKRPSGLRPVFRFERVKIPAWEIGFGAEDIELGRVEVRTELTVMCTN